MGELLTAKDVEVKVFKKVKFGGYSVPEVEDFLNQVADDFESYALQLDEKESRIQELESFVKKQEGMSDAIKDALIQAKRTAQEMEDKAKATAEKIIAEAKAEAAKHIADADGKVQDIIAEADKRASEITAKAKNSADEMIRNSQDRKARAEMSRANIEQELDAQRREAQNKADEILAEARVEARKLIDNSENEVKEFEKQIKYLNIQKQNFVKNTMSLLIDFGKIIDKAQQDIDYSIETESDNTEFYDGSVNDMSETKSEE